MRRYPRPRDILRERAAKTAPSVKNRFHDAEKDRQRLVLIKIFEADDSGGHAAGLTSRRDWRDKLLKMQQPLRLACC